MPLSPPVGRQHLHTRRVTCQGFFREDGLWDIEGRITDEKTYEHANEWRGPLKAGDFVHDMSIRLTLDHKFTIVDVEAVTDKSPYRICGGIAPDSGVAAVSVWSKPCRWAAPACIWWRCADACCCWAQVVAALPC